MGVRTGGPTSWKITPSSVRQRNANDMAFPMVARLGFGMGPSPLCKICKQKQKCCPIFGSPWQNVIGQRGKDTTTHKTKNHRVKNVKNMSSKICQRNDSRAKKNINIQRETIKHALSTKCIAIASTGGWG